MRILPRRSVKGLVIFIFATFLAVNLIFLLRVSENGSLKDAVEFNSPTLVTTSPKMTSSEPSQTVTNQRIPTSSSVRSVVTDNVFANLSESSDIKLLRKAFEENNRKEYVRNLNKFDLKGGEDTVVIIVQVHDRSDYLKYLIESLRQATGISQSLLVFSHDYFARHIHDTIASIDFCPVLQIYYPFAMQLYPKEFPGEHSKDCPRNIPRSEAIKSKCNNAEFPDHYGHYREAKYAQIKHHWFWKANYVFDQLTTTKYHRGPILFLEEDHFVAKDFLYTLLKMYRFRSS
ncbi:DgyrCDS5567 [Dimorphilus gyrociliatus]|uniref:Alpha-1,6-mannosyl-glycoprotein 2-beta-N-acetylglucosaminyltransferase n=1 Tax=Dimorphilus gyrociliatus TaxID=2664684 RepID=A0A7I8VK98_9ANNE|nr:DgyrCDS5567 [Dimorphilus gyrociliatus]